MTTEACFQPIHGISLERYADLGAAIATASGDEAKVRAIIEREGVALADWNAAKNGWTARMQDVQLLGRVATAFMPLYQAALARRRSGVRPVNVYAPTLRTNPRARGGGVEAVIAAGAKVVVVTNGAS